MSYRYYLEYEYVEMYCNMLNQTQPFKKILFHWIPTYSCTSRRLHELLQETP